MYSFGIQKGVVSSHINYLCDGSQSDHYGFLALFTGTAPTDHSQIAWDSGDPYEIISRMESGMIIRGSQLPQEVPGSLELTYRNFRTTVATKQPYLDPIYNKWSYTPSIYIFEFAYNDWKNDNMDGIESIWTNTANLINTEPSYMQRNLRLNHIYNGMNYVWTPHRSRDLGRRDFVYDFYYDLGLTSGRTGGSVYPHVIEYDQEVDIDSFEYYRGWFSSNNNSATQFTVEVWDPTLNSGQGDWGDSALATFVEDPNSAIYGELSQQLTGNRFRISFGDTGSSQLNYSWFRLMGSSTPANQRPSVDLTWGLMIPYRDDLGIYHSYVETRLWKPENRGSDIMINGKFPSSLHKGIPSYLVDVGDFDSGAACAMNKATGIAPGEVPELTNLILKFPR